MAGGFGDCFGVREGEVVGGDAGGDGDGGGGGGEEEEGGGEEGEEGEGEGAHFWLVVLFMEGWVVGDGGAVCV